MIFEFIFAMILYRKIKAIITLKIFAKNKVSGPIIVFRYAQKSNKNHYWKSSEYTPSLFLIPNSSLLIPNLHSETLEKLYFYIFLQRNLHILKISSTFAENS